MEEYHGQAGLLGGDLVEDIGVIHMGGRALSGHIVVGDIEGAVRGDNGTAGGEHPLLGDDQSAIGDDSLFGADVRFIRLGIIGWGLLAAGGQGQCHGACQQQGGESVFHIAFPPVIM